MRKRIRVIRIRVRTILRTNIKVTKSKRIRKTRTK